jgi:acyl carrier protein
MQNAKAKVKSFVMDNFILGMGTPIGDENSFLALRILDSTGVLELMSFLEESFGVKIEDEEIIPENLDSLNAIEAYLKRKLNH